LKRYTAGSDRVPSEDVKLDELRAEVEELLKAPGEFLMVDDALISKAAIIAIEPFGQPFVA
jgi:hypothetical protein